MGTFAESFRYIKDRKTFYETLDKAIAASEAVPGDPGFARAAAQMKAVKEWTANDERPSDEQVDSLDIDRVIAVEYEPLRSRFEKVDDWAKMVGEVLVYVQHWLDDDEFSEVDKFDLDWY